MKWENIKNPSLILYERNTRYSKYELEDEKDSIHVQVMLDIRQTSIEYEISAIITILI